MGSRVMEPEVADSTVLDTVKLTVVDDTQG